jgi:hypothetical protein
LSSKKIRTADGWRALRPVAFIEDEPPETSLGGAPYANTAFKTSKKLVPMKVLRTGGTGAPHGNDREEIFRIVVVRAQGPRIKTIAKKSAISFSSGPHGAGPTA